MAEDDLTELGPYNIETTESRDEEENSESESLEYLDYLKNEQQLAQSRIDQSQQFLTEPISVQTSADLDVGQTDDLNYLPTDKKDLYLPSPSDFLSRSPLQNSPKVRYYLSPAVNLYSIF